MRMMLNCSAIITKQIIIHLCKMNVSRTFSLIFLRWNTGVLYATSIDKCYRNQLRVTPF